MQAPQRILVIRLSSLGDILHTVPSFRALRRSFPGARIDWLVEEKTKFLLSAVPGIDQIVAIDTVAPRRRTFSRSSWSSIVSAMRTLRGARYDLSIDFQGLIKTGLLSYLSGARTRLGFGRSLVWERPAHWFYSKRVERAGEALHITALNQLLADAAGASPAPGPIDLKIPESASIDVEERLARHDIRDFAIVNPGGGWPTKRWPTARYAALADRLVHRLGLQVGSMMDLAGPSGPGASLRVVGIAEHGLPGKDGEAILVGWSDATTRFGVSGADALAVRFAARATADDRSALDETARQLGLQPVSLEQVQGAVGEALDRVFGLFDGLAIVAVVVAALGIVNTLWMDVTERVREIGILRATGMTRRQISRMVVVQAGIIGLVGAVLGIVTGFLAALLMLTLAGGTPGLSLIAWQPIVLAFVLGLGLAMVAAYYPARMAGRVPIVRAVRME